MFSVLGGTINTLIDSIFVSRVIGESALAAINLSMPVYLILCTIGSVIVYGSSILSAAEAGRGNMNSAQAYYRISLTLCLIAGVVTTALGIVFCRPIASMLTNGGTLTDQVYEYCMVSFIGSISTLMIYIPTSYLHIDGKRSHISVMMGILVATDVILDIMLIAVFPFGLYGASAASVLSVTAACVYGFIQLERGYSNYRLGLKLPGIKELGKLLGYGSPAALGNLYDALKLIILNSIILISGGESAAAVWAAVNTLSELSMIIILGVPRAASPLVAAFKTSKENGAIRILMKLEMNAGIVLSSVFTFLITALSEPIREMFGLSSDMLFPCLCLGVSTVFFVIGSVWDTFMNSTGWIARSNIMSAARRLVLPAAAAIVIVSFGGYLWLFLPISAVLTLVVDLVVTAIPYLKKKKTERYVSRYLLLDDYLERTGKVLDFSIPPDMDRVCDASEQIKDFCADNDMSIKQTVKLGLAIEELLNVIIEKSPGINSVDLRAFAVDGSAGIRIRCAGVNYDPFNDNSSDEDFLLGINMIKKMADVTKHTYTFGMNIINIIFPFEDQKQSGRDKSEQR